MSERECYCLGVGVKAPLQDKMGRITYLNNSAQVLR